MAGPGLHGPSGKGRKSAGTGSLAISFILNRQAEPEGQASELAKKKKEADFTGRAWVLVAKVPWGLISAESSRGALAIPIRLHVGVGMDEGSLWPQAGGPFKPPTSCVSPSASTQANPMDQCSRLGGRTQEPRLQSSSSYSLLLSRLQDAERPSGEQHSSHPLKPQDKGLSVYIPWVK